MNWPIIQHMRSALALLIKLSILVGLSSFHLGCSRAQDDSSKTSVTFRTPSAGSFSKIASSLSSKTGEVSALEALPTDKKICYGINVTGPGITAPSVPCLTSVGTVAGFAPENSDLSIVVPRGSGRSFELLVALVELDADCPSLSTAGLNSSTLNRTFISGRTDNVTLSNPEETVTIQLSFPGLDKAMAKEPNVASCLTADRHKGSLYSNGDVTYASGAILSESSPIIESFYITPLGDVHGIGFISSSNMLNFDSSPVNLPPQVYSLTRKPDTGGLYGLLHSGQIVEVSLSGDSTLVTIPLSCPFSAIGCKVPVWMQSISAGNFDELYGLDHAGTVYRIDAFGANETGFKVSEAVSQVSYY
jgi:hypothetical protein